MLDVTADNPGDWAFHCHKTHHAMNSMGHDMRNMIGVSIDSRNSNVGIENPRPDRHIPNV